MDNAGSDRRGLCLQAAVDVLLILLLSFISQGTHFSYKQGRALICGDSAQYVAAAEALTDPDDSPHFEMRKPGYALFLAGVSEALGNMGWAAVTGNHLFLGLLPLAAYCWGRHLRSRGVGWLAALLTTARLWGVVWGDRMLSEPLFTFLFSFGLLLFVVGLSRSRSHFWMVSAGCVLGPAWLTRGSASPAIAVALAAILIIKRRDFRGALTSCVTFAGPIACCVLVECGLNFAYAGSFRPSNGTVGATILLRARHFEGLNLPDTPDAARVSALLPERSREDAYLANHLDVWVARYHAVHELGMDDWEYDELMGRVGWNMLADNLGTFLRSSLKLALCHLFRQPAGQIYSPVPEDRRKGPLVHLSVPSDEDWDTTWFAYYGLPHMSPEDSIALVDRMKAAAGERGPLGGSVLWKALRYWKTKPVADASLALLLWLGTLWPGFALLGCPLLGLNRRTCAYLGATYIVDALFIGLLTPTNARLQFIWIVTDTALAAGLVIGVIQPVVRRLAALISQR